MCPTRAAARASLPVPGTRAQRSPAMGTGAQRPGHGGPGASAKIVGHAPPRPAQGFARTRHHATVRGRRPGRQPASDVAYRATIDDPRISEVRILRPQEIPLYVADGFFDLGITGRDWSRSGGAPWSRSASCPTPRTRRTRPGSCSPSGRLAGQLPRGAGRAQPTGPPLRVSTEYPELTRKALASHGIEADIALSYGATEAKVPDIADAVVDMTETGSALRAAGLR